MSSMFVRLACVDGLEKTCRTVKGCCRLNLGRDEHQIFLPLCSLVARLYHPHGAD